MILYCIPHCGGNEESYYFLKENKFFDVKYLKIRRNIFQEQYNNMEEIIESCYRQIIDTNRGEDYCIFGHSMGGMIAYELYYKIKSRNQKLPEVIFFSSVNVPGCKFFGLKYKNINRKSLVKYLAKYGGIKNKLINNKDFLSFIAPIIEHEIDIMLNFNYYKHNENIGIKTVVIYSVSDELIDVDSINEWKETNDLMCDIYVVSGGHFYFNRDKHSLLNILQENCVNII